MEEGPPFRRLGSGRWKHRRGQDHGAAPHTKKGGVGRRRSESRVAKSSETEIERDWPRERTSATPIERDGERDTNREGWREGHQSSEIERHEG